MKITGGNDNLVYMPTSSTLTLIYKVLGARGDMNALKSRNRRLSHSQKLKTSRGRNTGVRRALSEAGKVSVEVEYPGAIINRQNKRVKRVFAFILAEISKQALDGSGQLNASEISISLQSLVNVGMYSSTKTARVGVAEALEALTMIRIRGYQSKGSREISQDKFAALFANWQIRNAWVMISLNPELNWELVASYSTVFPAWGFALSNRAFDLLMLTMAQARQNANQIAQNGGFRLSVKAVQQRLGLPEVESNRRPSQTIIAPMIAAIDDINQAANGSMRIEFSAGDNRALNIITNQSIEIHLNEGIAQAFEEVSNEQKKRAEKAKKPGKNQSEGQT